MKKIFFDTDIFLRYPEVLSSKRNDADLIIPDVVLGEMRQMSNRFDDINNLIQNSKVKGHVLVAFIPALPLNTPGDTIWSVVDTSVIRYLITLQAKADGNEIIL